MSKQIPILFSTPMVQAILEGRKTMTRRIIKPQPDDDGLWDDTNSPRSLQSTLKGWDGTVEATGEAKEYKCPYGSVGDVLWVRETFCSGFSDGQDFHYKASDPNPDEFSKMGWKWKPSLFMPKSACRIFLEITKVRVERLQDITEEDAIAEGIKPVVSDHCKQMYENYLSNGYTDVVAKDSFKSLWLKINGSESWDANPFVWCIEFKKINKPS